MMEYELQREDSHFSGRTHISGKSHVSGHQVGATFREQVLRLAEEYESLRDLNRGLHWENARLRSIVSSRGGNPSELEDEQGVAKVSGISSSRSSKASRVVGIDDAVAIGKINRVSALTGAGVPEAPKQQVTPPKPPLDDPLGAAEVLSERWPAAVRSSELQHFEALNPKEQSHSAKPHVDVMDMDQFVLDICESDLASEMQNSPFDSDTSDDFNSGRGADGNQLRISEEDEFDVGGKGPVYGSASSRRSTSIFPRWFDPGDIEEQVNFIHASHSLPPMAAPFENDEYHNADRCTLLPFGSSRLTWDFFAFLCILCELWMTPFQLVYCENFDPPVSLDYLSYTINLFFGIDILFNFNTGYIEGDTTIMRRKKIFVHYIKFWFWIDMLATVPWDLILASFSGVVTVTKMGNKASKTLKAVRYLKMLRLIKLLRTMQKANSWFLHSQKLGSLAEALKTPCQLAIFLLLFAHIHGLIYAALQPAAWLDVETVSEALRRYGESCWWVASALSGGVPPGALPNGSVSTPGVWLLDMMVIFERFLAILAVSNRVILASLRYIDEARHMHARQEIMKHLRQNNVSIQTQIQVLFSMTETGKAKKWRKFFPELMSSDLPRVLQRTICAELWSSKLESMGLIRQVSLWHSGFVKELAQLAREEVFPSRTTVFKLGDASHVSYHIVTGVLTMTEILDQDEVPDFTKGMWVGESALVSVVLRRSTTCVARVITSCMAVNGDDFQQLLSNLGLMQEFQTFCADHLWKGICGRCGSLGDHFSDTCQDPEQRGSIVRIQSMLSENLQTARRSSWSRANSTVQKMTQAMAHATSMGSVRKSVGGKLLETPMGASLSMNSLTGARSHTLFARDLLTFLKEVGAASLLPALQDHGIYALNTLEVADPDQIHAIISSVCEPEQVDALVQDVSPSAARSYREKNTRKAHQALFRDVSRLHHLIFLSHYKLEAGTEAALMRTELETAIKSDAGNVGNGFDEPVFLDSDNLVDLGDLQRRVRNTHNVVLLLTKGVLRRPWVLVEIMTARREGVRIILVNVSKTGQSFSFPEDSFFNELRTGNYLQEDAVEVIRRSGFSLEDVEEALRAIFNQIALPYSPHKASGIRRAEINGVLKQCRLKSDGHRSCSGRGPTSSSDSGSMMMGQGSTLRSQVEIRPAGGMSDAN